jgi:NADPH2:quinone reductase
MRAVVITQPGAPDNIAVVEQPQPVAGQGQVVVRVAYAGCNFADTMLRAGTYPHAIPYPIVPGFEIAGEVTEIGPGVTSVRQGERVAAYVEHGGGYAEYCLAPEDHLIPLPDGVGLDVGAAFPIQALTAWHMIHTIGRTQPGNAVLIHAIGGGVGLNATQIAVHAGARVLGTSGTPGKERRALEFGATRVILQGQDDFVTAALELTNGRGVDLVLDSLGATTLDRSFDAVRNLGHIVSFGEAEGTPFRNIRERILPRSQTFTRFHLGHVDVASAAWQAGIEAVLGGLIEGWLRIPIEEVFPLERAADMHDRLGSRQVSGKLLLQTTA